MNYALVGCGRMGSAVDEQARRRGHTRVASIDLASRGRLSEASVDRASLGGAEVAFEFTTAEAAEANLLALVGAGIPVVCGTTGWRPTSALGQAIERSGVGVVLAPNFSVGVDLFFRIVREAAERIARLGLHRPFVFEMHHAGKRDAPSGTARHLAALLREVDPGLRTVVEGNPDGALPAGALHVASLRAGHEPGTHTVGFDGEYDRITLTHSATGRAGFALGAVLAAEWIVGRRGLHRFGDVVDALLEEGRLA